MANFDTIFALTGGTLRNQILPLVLAATTETVASLATDTSGTTVPAVLTIPGSSSGTGFVGSGTPVDFNVSSSRSSSSYGRKNSVGSEAPFFNAATFDKGRPFRLRISGNVALNAGAGNTIALNLYQGTSATVGSDVKIAAITAGGAPSTTVNFLAEAIVQWDSVGQKLSGYFSGQVGNTITAATALTNAATVTTAAGLTFLPSFVFGNAGGGTVTVAEFAVEQI